MKPYYEQDGCTIYHGDALAVLQELPGGAAQALVTDPPYSSGGAFRGDRMMDTTSKYVQAGTEIERPPVAADLSAGHVNGNGAQHRREITSHNSLAISRYAIENPKMFQVLCANCNWIKRYEQHEHTLRREAPATEEA